MEKAKGVKFTDGNGAYAPVVMIRDKESEFVVGEITMYFMDPEDGTISIEFRSVVGEKWFDSIKRDDDVRIKFYYHRFYERYGKVLEMDKGSGMPDLIGKRVCFDIDETKCFRPLSEKKWLSILNETNRTHPPDLTGRTKPPDLTEI